MNSNLLDWKCSSSTIESGCTNCFDRCRRDLQQMNRKCWTEGIQKEGRHLHYVDWNDKIYGWNMSCINSLKELVGLSLNQFKMWAALKSIIKRLWQHSGKPVRTMMFGYTYMYATPFLWITCIYMFMNACIHMGKIHFQQRNPPLCLLFITFWVQLPPNACYI